MGKVANVMGSGSKVQKAKALRLDCERSNIHPALTVVMTVLSLRSAVILLSVSMTS